MTTPTPLPDHLTAPHGDAPSTKDGRRRPRPAGWITVAVAVVGGLVVLSTITSSIFGNLRSLLREDMTESASAQGVTSLNADISSASLDIEFGDVDGAQLRVQAPGFHDAGEWVLRRNGGELLIEQEDGRGFGGGFGDFREVELTLTLPNELSDGGLDAKVQVASGAASVEGDFADLTLFVESGVVSFEGTAENLDITTGSGASNVEAEVSGAVSIAANSGGTSADFVGTAPKSVNVKLDSGFGSITLPEGEYRVERATSDSGTIDVGVTESKTAENTISASVGSGVLTLD